MKKIYLIGPQSCGKTLLMALIITELQKNKNCSIFIDKGSEIVTMITSSLHASQWSENIDSEISVKIVPTGRFAEKYSLQTKKINDICNIFAVKFAIFSSGYIIALDVTKDHGEYDSKYAFLVSNLSRINQGKKLEHIIVALTKSDNIGIFEPGSWLKKYYPSFFGGLNANTKKWKAYRISIYTVNGKPSQPLVVDGIYLLTSWFLNNICGIKIKYSFGSKLFSELNVSKQIVDKLDNNIKNIDKYIQSGFKNYPVLVDAYQEDYNSLINSGPIDTFINFCDEIRRNIPSESHFKIHIHNYLIDLCKNIYETTSQEKYKVILDKLKKREKEPSKIPDKVIEFTIYAPQIYENQGNTATLIMVNKSIEKIKTSSFKIQSDYADTKIYEDEIEIPPASKKEIKFWLFPKISGNIPLKMSIDYKISDEKKSIDEIFELKSEKEHRQKTNVQISIAQQQPPSTTVHIDINIERLIKKGKENDWLNILKKAIEAEKPIDLSSYPDKIKIYNERGFRNLILVIFSLEKSDRRNIKNMVKGDAFTYRVIDILVSLTNKSELEFQPGDSDIEYLIDGLHILSENYDLSFEEKKKIKDWKFTTENGKNITIKKTSIKDETGKAKSIKFTIENF